VQLARDLGADDVIDYRTQSLTGRSERYHVILELSGRLPFDQAHALLDEHGIYVDFSPSPASLIGNTIANPFRSHKHLFAMTAGKTADLEALAKMLDDGDLRPPPVQEFPLDRFGEAFEVAERGGVLGKVVVRVASR
jgi:NADPH:quinone reductase-like Zn-dependent oxidoreductase